MYERHFGLREMPFSITPDTGFFYAYPWHQEALNTLLIAVRLHEGFIKVVGEVGTGKTLVCRKLLAVLERDPGTVTAYLPNPHLTPDALLDAIADELGVEIAPGHSRHARLKALTEALIAHHARGARVVVLLDEAQALPKETLESLRLLTNLETEKRKLLQVILFGQPELDHNLALPSVRQLSQRITFAARLVPLRARDVRHYLRYRPQVAGRMPPLFSWVAARQISRASRGIPRLINILAHKALLSAYGEGASRVHARHVARAVSDTESVRRARVTRTTIGLFGALGISAVILYWMRLR